MVSLDLSVVNVGLPRIAVGLGFSPVGVTWVIYAYALTFGGLLLLGGKAADRYGASARCSRPGCSVTATGARR
jgi:MFS family permease